MRREAVCWNTRVPYGIHISFFFLSLEWAIYKVWVLREYRPSSSNQINTLWCCLPVCLSSTCEMWASHLFFICSVCSPCLFPHTHLLSLSLSLEGWDWISVLTLSTAPAPLQMTNLKRRRERIMGRKRTMAPSVHNSFIICYIVTFPFRLFLLLKQKHSSVTTHYIEWISEGSNLPPVKRKKNHKWDLVRVSIVSPRQLWVWTESKRRAFWELSPKKRILLMTFLL